jgi:hypothetical protein
MIRKLLTSLCIGAVFGLFALPAFGQQQRDLARFERSLEQIQRDTILSINPNVPVNQRVYFDYGAYITAGYLSLDDNVNDNHVLRQIQFLPYMRLNLDNVHEIFIRGIIGYRDFNEGDSFDGLGDEPIDGDLDVGYYKFDLARYMAAYKGQKTDYTLTVKGGRDLVYWANGLVLSDRLDGVMIDGGAGNFGFSFVAGVTPTRTVDFDATRPKFDFNTRRGFYGLMLNTNIAGHQPYVYAMLQRDYNDRDEELTSGAITTRFDYNSYYLGIGSNGPITDHLLYSGEFAYEGGNSLSNSFTIGGPFISPVNQQRDEIQAFAGDVRLDYLFGDHRNTRASGELIFASGDDDRLSSSDTFGGNKPGTKDRAFNAFGLLNTGLSFAPQVSNLLAFRLGVTTMPLPDLGPFRRMQVGSDFFLFEKLEGDAPIDEPSASGRLLGWEPDFYLNWQLTSDLTLAVRYGIFFPNSGVLPSDESRQFVFVGLTYAF